MFEGLFGGMQEVKDPIIIERIQQKYKKRSDSVNLGLIIFCIIFLSIIIKIVVSEWENFKGYELYFAIVMFIVFIVVVCVISVVLRTTNKVKKIIDSNQPLYYYTSYIEKIYVKRRYKDVDKYFLELKDDIRLRITRKQYKELINKDVNKVNVYFYEDFLNDDRFLTRFEIEGVE